MPRIRGGGEEEEEEGEDLAEVALKNAPPWLVSAVVHMLLVVVLGLLVISSGPSDDLLLEIEPDYHEELGEQLEELAVEVDTQSDQLEQQLTEELALEVEDPFAAPPELELLALENGAVTSEIEAKITGIALDGRDEGMKRSLLNKYGGDRHTEEAVKMALAWLAKQQRPDGSWSLKGPYSDGGGNENAAAATAMALLAFQGAGHTHVGSTSYKRTVAKGIKYLVSLQDAQGNFFQTGGHPHHPFYTQGQCTIAVCELYAMTRDSALKEHAQKAAEYCVRTQHSGGGWRYNPLELGDTSVSGWILMGLQSAKMGGIEVPQEVFDNLGRYLDSASPDYGVMYAYQPGYEPSRVMTAEALLCRQYLGWKQSDERLVKGAEYLLTNLPNWQERNVYYWYYATQMLHHMEGDYWPKWNNAMKGLLVDNQIKSGREKGSWDPLRPTMDRWAGYAGRLYVTCLSTYILEVYYRHLPIYRTEDVVD